MESDRDLIDELKELKENVSNSKLFRFSKEIPYPKYILPAIGFLILYFLYQLGYIFLYGFYFGGDRQFSIFSIMINPIPFNFKSIIGAGAFWLIYVLLICIPLVFISLKINVYALMCFILMSIAGILSLEYLFLGNISNQYLLPTNILGTPILVWYMFYIMYKITSSEIYGKVSILCIIYYFVILTIVTIAGDGEILKYNSIITLISYIYMLFIIPLVSKITEGLESKTRKALVKWINTIMLITLMLICNKEITFLFFLYLILLIYTESVKGEIIGIIKNLFDIYIISKFKNRKKEDDDKQIKYSKYKKLTSLCTGVLSVVVLYPIMASGMIMYASYIGDIVMKNYSINTIKYEFSEDGISSDKKEGIVVAQQGDTYYISQLPYRKLAIIKSKSIIVE